MPYRSRFQSVFLYSRTSLPTVGQVRGKLLVIGKLSLGKGIRFDSTVAEMQNFKNRYALLNDEQFASRTVCIEQKKVLLMLYIDEVGTLSELVLKFLSGVQSMILQNLHSTNQNA